MMLANWYWFRLSGNGFQAFKNDKTWFSYCGTRFPKWRNRFPLNLKRVGIWAECPGTRFPVWGNRFLLCVVGSELGQSALEPGSQFGGTGSCCVLLVLNLGRVLWNPVPSLGEPVCFCAGTRVPI